jgi:hypothetical protein
MHHGIKRIRLNNVGLEGVNNVKGIENLSELNIDHPQGIDPAIEWKTDVANNEILGGTTTYKIIDKKQLENEFILSTQTKEIKLYQNIFPDVAVTATESISETQIRPLYTAMPSKQSLYGIGPQNLDVQYAFQAGVSTPTFNRGIIGNNEGWASSGNVANFQLKALPNTVFRCRGEIEIIGTAGTENIYMSVFDAGMQYGLAFSYNNPLIYNSNKRGLGYLPLLKTEASGTSANPQIVPFDFMVTQSYSRVLDAPLGPSYTDTYYYSDGSTETTGDYPLWSFVIASDGYFSDQYSNKLVGNNSWIRWEPITVVDPNDESYTEQAPSAATIPRLLSGSLVQPPTTAYQNRNYLGNYGGLGPSYVFSAGDEFFIGTSPSRRYMVLWDDSSFQPNSFSPENLQQVTVGRTSTTADTGSKGRWKKGDLGWRYISLITTSSLVPIDNNDENYAVSSFNPLINNANNLRRSNIYCDLDYSRGATLPLNRSQVLDGSAVKAEVVDSNYSSRGWSNIRYNGSRVTSNNINER